MEFGRVTETAIEEINHTLGPDGRITKKVLKADGIGACKFHVGLSRWGRKEWCGSLYPERTKESDFLYHYSKHFNSIELNATFFSIPNTAFISRWREEIQKSGNTDFLFVPKVSKEITHKKKLKECLDLMQKFLEGVSNFGDNLGPIFFQMGDHFGPSQYENLKIFISELPKDKEYFFEVRNEDFYSDEIDNGRYFDLLNKNGIGSIISDTSGRRDCVHMELTTPDLFLRFVGNGGEYWQSDFKRIDAWIDRIERWTTQNLRNVYFFVHQYDETYSPQLASYVIDQLNLKLQTNLKSLNLPL